MSEPTLDRATITEALRRLGDRLAYRGLTADLYVFVGAAMALAYDLRRSTRDIDALFQPHGAVVAEAESVALELGLPRVVAERTGQRLRGTGRRHRGAAGLRPPRAARPRRTRSR